MGDIVLKYSDAGIIADEIISKLKSHFTKWCICGSLRRQKELVGDIDIVAIIKSELEYDFGELSLSEVIKLLDPLGFENSKTNKKQKLFLNGPKIKRFTYKNITIDLYIADESTFETLKLIRTGSIQHNIRLTKLARQKGMKLFASGKGLCTIKGGWGDIAEEITKVVEDTEDGILQNLLGRIPIPCERGWY